MILKLKNTSSKATFITGMAGEKEDDFGFRPSDVQ